MKSSKNRDEDEALEYAIHNQRDRRNMMDADIMRCVEALDRRKERGGDRKSEDFQKAKLPFDSSEQAAKTIGISPRKVRQARTVLDHASEQTKQEVLSGKKSINKAYFISRKAEDNMGNSKHAT